jgi:glycerol-3-phosphate acyltransferase PlsY
MAMISIQIDYILVPAIAYLIGSIPFGYILVRLFRKQDIRTTGSGNIGATNVARTAPALGIATLVLDALKGLVPLYILSAWAYDQAHGAHRSLLVALAALFAVLGHIFPIWLGFRGGKGVATATGVFLVLCPRAVGLSLLVFLVVLIATRYVSLGSILGTACFPLFAYYLQRSEHWDTRPLLVSSIVIAILIIAKHHENIRRLISGTESRFGKKKAEAVIAED